MAKRIQRIVAESGLMSRRKAEAAILAGRVTCNGKTAVLGDTAEEGDIVFLDGRPIPNAEPKRYYMLNKPKGYVCTMEDEEGRKTVRELLPPDAGRVYPVGRLDLMSEGLLLMSNDGAFAYRLTHPSERILKTYRVKVHGHDLDNGIARFQDVFILDGVAVKPEEIKVLSRSETSAVIEITIGEGRNREIRRMCEIAGLHIRRLVRVQEGNISLGNLGSGMYRILTAEEIASVLGASGSK